MAHLRFTVARNVCRFLPPIVSQTLRNFIYPIRIARHDNFAFTQASQTGSMLTNEISDSQAYRFSIHGYHEWRNLAIATALCSPGDTIIEIGAHIGTETIGFSDIVGTEGKVYAFEPLPSSLAILKENSTKAQYKNIIVSPLALSDESKKMQFVLPDKKSSGLAHILGKNENPSTETINVECTKLDSLSDSIGYAKAIFIDAEGADMSILQGGKSYITNYNPNIVLECYPRFLERAGFSVQELHETIKSLGYEVFEISRLGLARIASAENYERIGNWFCASSSKFSDIKTVHKYLKMCGILPCIPGLNPMSKKPIITNSL